MVAPKSALIEGAPAEPTPPPVAPPPKTAEAELELKLAEGVKLDDASLSAFKGVAKELGLDSPKAQKLVDLYGSMQTSAQKAQQEAYTKLDSEWVAALKADPEIGGSKLEASTALARKAVARFGGNDLAKLIDSAGLGNNPVFVKAFHAIGKAMAEDSVAVSTASGTTSVSDRALLEALYPSMTNKE